MASRKQMAKYCEHERQHSNPNNRRKEWKKQMLLVSSNPKRQSRRQKHFARKSVKKKTAESTSRQVWAFNAFVLSTAKVREEQINVVNTTPKCSLPRLSVITRSS